MEHLLNVYAARHARGAVADFLGYCEVEYGQASGKLSEGVWLVRHHLCNLPQATCDLQVPSTPPRDDGAWLWCNHSSARMYLQLLTGKKRGHSWGNRAEVTPAGAGVAV